jgi:hypothetical protein
MSSAPPSLEHTKNTTPTFFEYPGRSYRILDKREEKQFFLEAPHDLTAVNFSITFFKHSKTCITF